MRKFTRSISLLLVLVLVMACLPLGTFAADSQTKTQYGDLVLVLDDTGSMAWNDPTRAAQTAVKVFGSLLAGSNDDSDHSNVGIVTFSDRVVATFDMAPVNGQTLADLGTFSDTKITRSGQWTDIVVGLTKALEMLLDLPDDEHTKAIVVVTDGENEFGGRRTKEMSDTELKLVKELAQKAGIKIFLIGLNTDQDKVSEYMNGIADATGGSVAFIDDASQIYDTIKDFYAELGLVEESSSEDIEVTEDGVKYPLTIPENTFEAIVTMIHTSPLVVTITDHNGDPLPESDTYTLLRSDTSTIIKLREPPHGKYTLHIKNENVSQQNVHLDTFLNSEVLVQVNVPATVKKDSDLTIDAALMRGNQQYQNADLQNLTATAVLTNGADSVSVDLALNADQFSGSVRLPATGKWNITVTVRSDKNFIRTNDQPASVEVVEPVAATTPNPTPAPKPAAPDIPLWVIILIAVIVLVLIVAGIIVFKFLDGVPKKEQLPMRTLSIVCSTDKAKLWQIDMACKPMFTDFKYRKNGRTLLSCYEAFAAKMNSAPKPSESCKELFSEITIKPTRSSKKGSKAYDFRFTRLSSRGSQTLTSPVTISPEPDIRVSFTWK